MTQAITPVASSYFFGKKSSVKSYFYFVLFGGHVLFVGPVIPLFWTSGDVWPGLQTVVDYLVYKLPLSVVVYFYGRLKCFDIHNLLPSTTVVMFSHVSVCLQGGRWGHAW